MLPLKLNLYINVIWQEDEIFFLKVFKYKNFMVSIYWPFKHLQNINLNISENFITFLYGTKARPTLLRPLCLWARLYAWACCLRLSSKPSTTLLLSPAALAPGPRWANLSRRHKACPLTTCTEMALLMSPTALLNSQPSLILPLDLAMDSTLFWASAPIRTWKS